MPESTLFVYTAPTGSPIKTKGRHYFKGALVAGYHRLKIVQDSGENTVLMLGLDGFGNEIVRTWHDSVERAFEYADHEMSIRRDEWSPVTRNRS